MNRVKKTLIWILAGAAVIWAVLFAVEVVDKALHGADYKKLDAAVADLKEITEEHQDCTAMLYIWIEFLNDEGSRPKFDKLFQDKERMRRIQSSCSAAEAETAAISVADMKYEQKKQQFEEVKRMNLRIYNILGSVMEVLEKCKAYDQECNKMLEQVPNKYGDEKMPTRVDFFEKGVDLAYKPTVKSLLATLPLKAFIWDLRRKEARIGK